MKVQLLILALTATVAYAAIPMKLNIANLKFNQFKKDFNKIYETVEEEAKRLAIFTANLEIIFYSCFNSTYYTFELFYLSCFV